MEFVIKGMKYNTEKMEKVAEVRKWYRVDTFFNPFYVSGKRGWPDISVRIMEICKRKLAFNP